jgi:hypothetical protein
MALKLVVRAVDDSCVTGDVSVPVMIGDVPLPTFGMELTERFLAR